jgi:hypothetical protein
VEIERLQRTLANMSLQNQSTQQSVKSDDAADNLHLPKSTLKHQDPENPNTKILKIQDLCQVNLSLLWQKRSAVKHVVAINSEIEDISAVLKEVIGQMHAATGLGLADEMLATENKALLMAQLQAQSTLQSTESELQSCREELKQTKVQLSALQNQIAEEGKTPLSRRPTRSSAPPPSQQKQQQQEQGQGVSVTDTFPLVSQKGGVFGAEGNADKTDALELAARLQKSEEEADFLRTMLEQEQERSRMQLADLQEELNSVHQSRMSESMRIGNAGLTSQQCIEGISLKLDMQLNDIENSVEFVQAVKLDLCLALGISAARIQMHGLRAGSVIVDMAVLEGVNQSDRTPGEILMGLLRQIKDSSSELMRGSMTSKIISIEIYLNERVYQESIKPDGNDNETSSAVDESTRSTSNWIELVEQQTRQLKMQTADMAELEAEVEVLKSRNRQLEDQLHNTQTDASNWKHAFDNLEAQLNQHNVLIKKHLDSAEGRADGLQREKELLAAELKNMTQRYIRASQESLIKVSSRDSVRSVETVDSEIIITESAMVLTPNITRAAPPPVPARTSPLAVRSLSLSEVIDTVPIVSERGVVFVAAGVSSAEPTTTSDAPAPIQDSSRSVDLSLNLSLPFEAAGKEGSMERSAFEKQLKEDLAHSSGMPTSSFAIKNLTMTELASRILMNLSITPHQMTASGPEPLEVAVELEKQAQDHTSRLRNAALTRHVAEVAVHPTHTVLVQFKMIREENQRLREQIQNLRAQALKGDAEIESHSSKIKDLQKELAEHLTIAKQLQAQVDSSIRQLKKVQNDNAELASRLERADTKAERAIQELEEAQVSRKANEGPGGVVDELQRRNREYENRLREAEEQLNKVALVLEQRQQQEEELSLKHHELTRDFGREKLEKEELQRECQSSQAVIEKLKAHLAQERSETEDLIAKMSKVTHEKEEALQRMRDAESHLLKSSGEVIQDLAARLQEERTEKEAASTKFREANQQIHDLQVQGVQLAQAKIFLEEKVVLLTGMHEKEKEEIRKELNRSRHRAAELESLCAASTQRVEELMHKMDKTDGDNSERRRGDEVRDKSISDLEMRLEGLRLELHNRDKQISKLQEALSCTRSKIKSPGNSSPQNSTRSFSYESPRFTGDDAGKIQPFYGGYSQSQSMQDDIEMRIATRHQLKVQRTTAPPPRTSQSYSPVSSPSTSPLNSVPGSIFGYTPIGQPASNSATRGSILSLTSSIGSNPFRDSMGHTDLMLSLNTQPSRFMNLCLLNALCWRIVMIFALTVTCGFDRATVPDVKPTFPASTQLSFFQSKPTYQGELKEGWPHGRGITVWPDGRVYDGHWRQGIFQGHVRFRDCPFFCNSLSISFDTFLFNVHKYVFPRLNGFCKCVELDQARALVCGQMATRTKANGERDSRMAWECTRIPTEMLSKENSNRTNFMDTAHLALLKMSSTGAVGTMVI